MGLCVENSEFARHLSEYSQKKVFFDRLAGNNGDRLITMGAEIALERAQVVLTDSPSTADLILLNGGGAMNDFWGGGIARVEFYGEAYPNKPLTIAPSSFLLQSPRLKDALSGRKHRVTVFCRERASLQHLSEVGVSQQAHLRLSPDLAFELAGTKFLAELRARRSDEHVLVAMRKDREGAAGVLAKTRGTWLPRRIRRPLSRFRDLLVASRSRAPLDAVFSAERIGQEMPKIFRDVSVSVDFEEFLDLVARSRVILTDRLHVAILGRLLDKPVRLFPGSYHKIRGVFEYSLSDQESRVELML